MRESRRRIAALKDRPTESGVQGLSAAALDALDQLDALLAKRLAEAAAGVVMSLRDEARIVSWRQALFTASRDCAPGVRAMVDAALAPLRWPFSIDDTSGRLADVPE